jgi:NitT/TauT family transport system permease protein
MTIGIAIGSGPYWALCAMVWLSAWALVYAASHAVTLRKLRLPAAMPFVFNGLKINTTLALIGAIVAEFFGTPIVGLGFRINAEVGRMNIDMVWATMRI